MRIRGYLRSTNISMERDTTSFYHLGSTRAEILPGPRRYRITIEIDALDIEEGPSSGEMVEIRSISPDDLVRTSPTTPQLRPLTTEEIRQRSRRLQNMSYDSPTSLADRQLADRIQTMAREMAESTMPIATASAAELDRIGREYGIPRVDADYIRRRVNEIRAAARVEQGQPSPVETTPVETRARVIPPTPQQIIERAAAVRPPAPPPEPPKPEEPKPPTRWNLLEID